MPAWEWVAAVIVGVFFWRVTFRAFAFMDDAHPDAEDVIWSLFFATLLFPVVGPVVVLVTALRRATHSTDWEQFARRLGGEPAHLKRRRKERELRERERAVKQAEQELGL